MDNHVINHWRKFIDDEYADEHLECEVQVFGKLADDRYINRGSVTYDEIYHENLDQEYYDMMKNKLGDYKVSLYSREFIGIDKQCDEKTLVTREQNEKLNKSQKDISRVFIVEGVINLCLSIGYFVIFIIWVCCQRNNTKYKYIVNVGYNILLSEMIITLGCLIAQAVYLSRIKKNDISYQCSDSITNELFRTQKDITNKSITYSWINLGFDIFVIVGNVIAMTIGALTDKNKDDNKEYIKPKIEPKMNINENNVNNSDRRQFNSNNAISEKVREVIVDNNYNFNNYNNFNNTNYSNNFYNPNINYNNNVNDNNFNANNVNNNINNNLNNNYNTNYNSNNYNPNYNNNPNNNNYRNNFISNNFNANYNNNPNNNNYGNNFNNN